jgi:phage terminase small subunit
VAKLRDKQRRFADEYIIDQNATRAYKAAYPRIKSDEVARAAGARMLTFVNVSLYISEQLEKISSAKIADATEVMEYMSAVMRGETRSEIVVVEANGDGSSSARRMDKSPDEKERLKAGELLGKRYKLFSDGMKVDGTVSIVVREDLPYDDD